ncbi:hypothetical protein F5Y16DRAFT_384007 [Xylariaceae sp. FL0255]|nr:hypothetical protein F5Y16DRAFT_384007 [Xylariaceae sp. FL0255]
MSLGFGIGEIKAIGETIKRIVGEVKAYQAAPLHFQRLAIELEFLGSVCKQVFELRPALPEEHCHIERIRAIAIQCLGPLQEFQGKMARYESTLGSHRAQTRSSGSKIVGNMNRIKAFGTRLHWSTMDRVVVDELRAILTSEILAINTLLSVVKWNNLKRQSEANQTFATQLEILIRTTDNASKEIKQFLVDAKIASERLEHQVKSGNMTQEEQTQMLKSIEIKTTDTHQAFRDLARSQGEQAARAEKGMSRLSGQLANMVSFKEHMESWISQIVNYCKSIIYMVEKNTQILLSLHGMMTKVSALLSQSAINLPILEFEDPFGQKLALPFQLCDTWEGMNQMLLCVFSNRPGLDLVQRGRFRITNAQTNRTIKPSFWRTSVAPGDRMFMSMCLERYRHDMQTCPRCDQTIPGDIEFRSGVTCHNCHLWYSTTIVQFRSPTPCNTASSREIATLPSFIPIIARKSGPMKDRDFTTTYLDFEPANLSSLILFLRLKHRLSSPKRDVVLYPQLDTFRRVHVIPFQEDPLERLLKIGYRFRRLMLDFWFNPASSSFTLSSEPFAETFIEILSNLNEIFNSGINPLMELWLRKGTKEEKTRLEMYLTDMAKTLEKAPVGDCDIGRSLGTLVSWMRGYGS